MSSIFWDTNLCSPLKVNRRFGGTCRLHLQCQRISQARNQLESSWQAELCDIVLGNFCWPWTNYKALYPRRQNSSRHDFDFISCFHSWIYKEMNITAFWDVYDSPLFPRVYEISIPYAGRRSTRYLHQLALLCWEWARVTVAVSWTHSFRRIINAVCR
jgi:hypothetical protein